MCRDCNAPKEDSCVVVAVEQMAPMKVQKSSVLMVSGLAEKTTEATLEYIFGQYDFFKCVTFEKKAGDQSTHRGFAFVKFESTEAATAALDIISEYEGELNIDGNEVAIKYAKESKEQVAYAEASSTNSAASAAIEAALAMSRPAGTGAGDSAKAGQKPVRSSATAAATAAAKAAAAAEAEAAAAAAAAMPPGVPLGLILDPSSGYYFDPTTKYYWDIPRQLYYDGVNSRYLTWDAAVNVYVEVDIAAEEKKREKQAKLEEAKRVAKEMAKFEKKQRKLKESKAASIAAAATEPASKATATAAAGGLEVAAASTAKALLLSNADAKDTFSDAEGGQSSQDDEGEIPLEASLLLQYSLPGADQWEGAIRRGHVKPDDAICMLCRTRLGTKEKLQKHTSKSKLHLGNLEKEKARILGSLSDEQSEQYDEIRRQGSYQDRAANRRKMHGHSKRQAKKEVWKAANPRPEKPVKLEQPTKAGIGSSNIGFKMMKSMGWSGSSGLGKESQGITAPIEAKKHVPGAGIGAGIVLNASESRPEGSYKEKAAVMARARYMKLNKD